VTVVEENEEGWVCECGAQNPDDADCCHFCTDPWE